MKIGILTYHRSKNYGAFLQAYSLCALLNNEPEFDAEIIDFQMQKEKDKYSINNSLKYSLFHYNEKEYMKSLYKTMEDSLKYLKKSKDYLCSDSLEEFFNFVSGKYDIIIAGSDEIWKIDGFRGFPTPYWLIGDLKCIKTSYAASSRTPINNLDNSIKEKIEEYLSDFSIISVRDKVTYDEITSNIKLNKSILISPDPTLVYNHKPNIKKGNLIINRLIKGRENKKIAILMTGDKKIAKLINKMFNKDYYLISVFHYHKGYYNISDITPFEWIDLLASCDFIFTSYFHAVCFSLLLNKKFMSFGVKNKSEKVLDILKNSNNEFRFIEYTNLQNNDIIYNVYKESLKEVDSKCFIKKCKKEFEIFKEELNKIK